VREHGRERDAHDDQEAGAEPAEVDEPGPRGLHEVVRVRAPLADEVGERRAYVCCDYEEGEVVVPERRGEDDEEEAYC
jgi:hypothetical protein